MNDKFNICLICENKKPYNCADFDVCIDLLESNKSCFTCRCSDCFRVVNNNECLLSDSKDNFIPIKKGKNNGKD